jgi:hypothetical protein
VNIYPPTPQARGATGNPVNRQSLASRQAFFMSFLASGRDSDAPLLPACVRNVLFALAFVLTMAFAFPSHAQAQAAGYWTYGNTGMCAGAYCSSAMAACEAYRAADVGSPTAVITAFTPNPRLNEYFTCTVVGPIDGTA